MQAKRPARNKCKKREDEIAKDREAPQIIYTADAESWKDNWKLESLAGPRWQMQRLRNLMTTRRNGAPARSGPVTGINGRF